MGFSQKPPADPQGPHCRVPKAGLVALRQGPPVASTGGVPRPRGGVPGVRGQGDRSWGERSGQPLPPSGRPMGRLQKRHADAGEVQPLQQPQGLVDLSLGPWIPGGSGSADGERLRLSLLCGPESPGGVQRPGRPGAPGGRKLAPQLERDLNAGHGHRGQPPEGLVAVPGGAQLESGGLFQNRVQKVRLSGVRRTGTPPAPTALRAP